MGDQAERWREVLDAVRQHRARPLDDQGRRDLMTRVLQVGRGTVPGVVSCSVTLRRGTEPFGTPALAGELARGLDEVQYRLDDGPCLTAARTGERQRIDDMQDDARWPRFAGAAADLGVRASFSMPIRPPGHQAALNLYAADGGAFAPRRPQLLAGLVAHVVLAVLTEAVPPGPSGSPVSPGVPELGVPGLEEARHQGELVRRAQRARMERDGLPAATAYRDLAVRSAREQRRLADIVAEELA